MKNFTAALLAVVTLSLLGLAGSAFAGALPIYGGPAQTNPIANPATQPDINALVNAVNGMIGPGMTGGVSGTNLTPGSVGGLFTGGSVTGTFQSQGLLQTGTSLTTGTNCIRSSAGGNCGTFKWFLTFVDSQGIQSFIPVFQ